MKHVLVLALTADVNLSVHVHRFARPEMLSRAESAVRTFRARLGRSSFGPSLLILVTYCGQKPAPVLETCPQEGLGLPTAFFEERRPLFSVEC